MTHEKPQVVFRPDTKGPRFILAPFVPTPPDIVEQMLTMAGVTSDDLIYDLGCGDGRIIITAALTHGTRGVGVDIEPYNVEQAQLNARNAGVEHLVTFVPGDALALDLSSATVITLYLVQWSTNKVQSLLTRSVQPGTRVVSHNYLLEGVAVESKEVFDVDGQSHKLHLWISP